MTPETRRNIFRYGIAVDLVILATGVGMLFPMPARALVVLFVGAVALTVWKGGWKGGLAALVMSMFALAYLSPEVGAPQLIELTGAAIAAGAIISAAQVPKTPLIQPTAASLRSNVVAFTSPVVERPPLEAEEAARESTERHHLARTLEQTAAAQIEALRSDAGRSRRDAEEAAARERVAQEEAARLAEQQRLAAEEEAGRGAEEERRAAEARESERTTGAGEDQRRFEAPATSRRSRRRHKKRGPQPGSKRGEAEQVLHHGLEAERGQQEEAERALHEKLEAERRQQEEAERLLQEKLEAERRAEAERRQQEEAERLLQEKLEAERRAEAERRQQEEAERLLQEKLEAERRAEAERRQQEEAERLLQEKLEAERRQQEEAERLLQEKTEAERRAEEELRERLEAEREALRLQIEKQRAAEEELRVRLEAEREALRAQMEKQLAAEREAIERDAAARVEAARKTAEDEANRRVAAEAKAAALTAAASTPAAPATAPPAVAPRPAAPKAAAPRPAPPKPSVVATLKQTFGGWFQSSERGRSTPPAKMSTNVAPVRKAITPAGAPVRRPARTQQGPRKPRLLMVERRRGTADTAAPKLRQRGLEISVVERWVDAVDEIFRVRPDAIVLDVEHPEFEKIHRTLGDKYSDMPIVLSGGRVGSSAPPSARRAAFVVRPYDIDELVRLAEKASSRPADLLAEQAAPRTAPKPAPLANVVPAPPQRMMVRAERNPSATPAEPAPASTNADSYEVACFSCRVPFDAVDADWCSCLAKERSLVCTNCLSCFCKAPPSYKEKFWVQAPPRLFERKTSEARRQQKALPVNPSEADVKRPLVLTVEDDEDIQAIIARVCSNLGYGFIYATNGQDGLDMARAYRPNLILSDAFMPKLDGREMCRLLKEDRGFDCKMVVMTGLYTDTKYRSEALKRFHVDDYIAKPVSITDLINLLQKHLEGITGLPVQEDLHELHRQDIEEEQPEVVEEGIPLAEILDTPQTIEVRPRAARPQPKNDAYEVCCFNCQNTFDATRSDWCTCVGRDQTVVCSHCGGCFCKSPAPYKERFWMDAPPSLFERKMLGSKRHHGDKANPIPGEVKRPLILLVEDDENIQLIVKTVVTTMGFGFVVGANGQEGLSLAREYNPDLILSDAFMPKLDGREMCRLLKEDPATSGSKAIIMTGLYTDRKYRNEALDYFKVDDYVAKPLAVDDLIKLFKKHLPQEVHAAN